MDKVVHVIRPMVLVTVLYIMSFEGTKTAEGDQLKNS